MQDEKDTLRKDASRLLELTAQNEQLVKTLDMKNVEFKQRLDDMARVNLEKDDQLLLLRKENTSTTDKNSLLNQKNQDLCQEINHLLKEKHKLLTELDGLSRLVEKKDRESSDQINFKTKELATSSEKVAALTERLYKCERELSFTIDKDHLSYQLQRQLSRLESENENLRLELKSRPSLRRVKDCERKIQELEATIDNDEEDCEENQPTLSKSPTKKAGQTTVAEIRKDKELAKLPPKQFPSTQTMRRVITDLLEELSLENINQIIPKIRNLSSTLKGKKN